MASSRIKGITVEIGGDTTKLQTALKGVNSQIKNTQSQLRDVNKLLKLDPGNTDLIKQKHELLAQAVSETKEKLESLKTAAEQANTALANGEISKDQYDALQREIIETEQDLKKLEEQAKESATAVQKVAASGEKIKAAGDKVSGVGEKLMPATIAVAGLGVAATKTAADFDAAMSKVAAVSGASGKELDALRKKAREMGSKTKFSASEAAEAMNYMAMAGWKTDDMLGGIEGVMNLAAASGEDLGTTSDIVTDALTAFGLSADDSGHFADVLAAASSNANTNVSMMGETFKYAAPIAGSLGYSVEDTAEAIGLMANAGIKSSQAGTSLRKIMTELNGDIKLSGKNIGDVTVKTANADGTMRDFGDIIKDCRTAFKGMSESEQAVAAESLVGKTAMSGFLAIMNAAPADIDKLSKAIDTCDGKAEEMAGTMQDNLQGQLTILKSQLEELAISFGELMMPAIRSIVSVIQKLVDGLNKLSPGAKKVIITIALLVAALGPVLIVVGKVMSAVGTIMTWAPKIATAIGAIKTGLTGLFAVLAANPIILIIAGIVALVAAFIYLWKTNEKFRNFWINLWKTIKDTAVKAWTAITTFFSTAWQGIVTLATGIWQGLSDFFSGLWEGIKGIASAAWDGIKTVITGFMDIIWTATVGRWAVMYEVLSPLLEALKYLFQTIWGAIKVLIGRVLDAIKTKFETIWNGIVAFFTPVINGMKTLIETVWNGIKAFFTTVLGAIKTVFTTIWTAISTTVGGIVSGIATKVSTAWSTMQTGISTVMGNIKTNVATVWGEVKKGTAEKAGEIYKAIKGGFDKAVKHITDLVGNAYSWGRDMIQGIIDGIKDTIEGVADAVTDVADTIHDTLHFSRPDTGPLREYEKWMPDFMQGLADGINGSKGLVTSAMDSLAAGMVISPNVDASSMAMAGGPAVSGSSGTDIVSAIKEAMTGVNTGGDTIIPVYIGQERIDEIVVKATQRSNYRSGGR